MLHKTYTQRHPKRVKTVLNMCESLEVWKKIFSFGKYGLYYFSGIEPWEK